MPKNICTGDGSCLLQVDYLNMYMKNASISCKHNCKPIECPNFIICGHLEPEWVLCCYNGVCGSPCSILFGRLQFSDNQECPICLETKSCVKQLHCDHKICTDCFKRCHLPPYWNDPQPKFPYDSDLEDKYDLDPYDPKWRGDPLIEKYKEEWEEWENERENKEASESYLKICSVCRK